MIKISRQHTNYPKPFLFGAILMMFFMPILQADTLHVGKPIISGTNYTFPIYLDSASADVAVMDFRFNYDPEVFRPVEAQTGAQADFSNKIVNANQSSPGEYIVVLWGPNQNTLNSGEVARIVLEHTGYESDNTQLAIAGLTMADPYGAEVYSSAQGIDMNLGGDSPPDAENPPPSDGQTGENPKPDDGTEALPTDTPTNLADALGGILGVDEKSQSTDGKNTPRKSPDNTTLPDTSPSPGATDGTARLATLRRDAELLRTGLPIPAGSEIGVGENNEKVFTEKKKHGTITTVSGMETSVPDAKDVSNDKNATVLQAHLIESDKTVKVAGKDARAGALLDKNGQGDGIPWILWAVVFTGTLIIGLSLMFILRAKYVSKYKA